MKRPVTVKRVCYILSYVVGIGVPVWAVLEKFPIWAKEYSPAKSAGIGLLLIACIVVAVGRKVIVPAIAKWLGWLVGWVALALGAGLLAGISVWLYNSLQVLHDLGTVCIACCVGFSIAAAIAAVGKIIGESEAPRKEDRNGVGTD